jgi:hypothetical protein
MITMKKIKFTRRLIKRINHGFAPDSIVRACYWGLILWTILVFGFLGITYITMV